MSTSALLLIALASVVLLLLLVIKAKAHPCGAPDRQSAGGIRHRHSGR